MDSQSLRDQYEDELAKILQEEIDWEVMSTLLVESGYTRIIIEKSYELKELLEMKFWLEYTCKGKYFQRGNNYVFEKTEDAEWFILRWS